MKSTTSIRKIKSEFTLQNETSVGGIKVFLEYLVIQPCLPSDLILDLDSTVETVYGE